MNLLDVLIIGVIALSTVFGMHQGFVSSVLNMAGFFVSWFAANTLYPVFSSFLTNNTPLMDTIAYYVEGTLKQSNLQLSRTAVEALNGPGLSNTVASLHLPPPIDSLLIQNIQNNAFINDGLRTLDEYVSKTILSVSVNIISYVAVFLITYLVISLAISLVKYVFKFPVLRQLDGLMGACFGVLRGIFLVFVVFALVPIFLAVIPVDNLEVYVDGSALGSFFYRSNFLFSMIKGFIP